MKLLLLILLLLPTLSFAQIQGQGGVNAVLCDSTARYSASTNGSTQLVALTADQKIYICGWKAMTTSTTGVNVKLIYGTGTNCATNPVDITMVWNLDSDVVDGFVDNTTFGNPRKTAAGNALCINTDGAVSVQAEVQYTQF